MIDPKQSLGVPVEVFCLAEYVADEMIARNWTSFDVANRMSDPEDFKIRLLMVEFFLAVQDDNLILEHDFLSELSRAFGVSVELFSNLHKRWLENPTKRSSWECPESLLAGAQP
jgi:hypothetical protein